MFADAIFTNAIFTVFTLERTLSGLFVGLIVFGVGLFSAFGLVV